jgi:prolipoprotein diacylglyceryl transferase
MTPARVVAARSTRIATGKANNVKNETMLSLFINWDVNPELLKLGAISIRYYGLLFALAFLFGYKVEEKMFKSEKLPSKWLDKLWLYVAVATIVGARLGHCFFYEWDYYRDHFFEIFLPFRYDGGFQLTGFQGLASHGAAIGIIAGLWYYSRKVSRRSILWILDRAVVPIALAGFFIRMGNLMNSEIIGLPTDLPWGFRFVNAHGVADPLTPRHPSQLYEALCYLASFGALMYLYWRTRVKEREGFLFGMFLILIFTCRFFIEFLKENQEDFEATMLLDMGQVLSVPFILTGCIAIWYSQFKQKITLRKSLSLALVGVISYSLFWALPSLLGVLGFANTLMGEWGITTGLLLSYLLFLLGLSDFGVRADKAGKEATGRLTVGIIIAGAAAFIASYAWLLSLLALAAWATGYKRLKQSTTLGAMGKQGVAWLLASTLVAAAGWLIGHFYPAGETIKLVALLASLVLLIVGWVRVRNSLPDGLMDGSNKK